MRKLAILFLVFTAVITLSDVGLVLAGQVTNAEKQMLTDGDMEASSASTYTAYNTNSTVSKVATDTAFDGKQVLRITSVGTGLAGARIPNILDASGNTTYRVTVRVRSDGNTVPRLQTTGVGGLLAEGTNSTEWQTLTATAKMNGYIIVIDTSALAGEYLEVDNFAVTVYRGASNNAEKQILTDGDMEASGTTAYSNYSGGTATKDTTIKRYGKQSIKIEATGTGQARWRQDSVFTTDLSYRISGWAYSDGVRVPSIATGAGQTLWTGTNILGWQYFNFTATINAGSFNNRLLFGTTSGGAAGQFTAWDDLSVTLNKGSTKNAEKTIIADGDMEASGTSSWGSNINSTPSKVAGYYGAGLQTVSTANTSYTGQAVTVSGNKYKISGYYKVTGGGGNAVVRSSTSVVATLGNSATWTYFSAEFTAVSNFWGVGASLNGTTIQWDELTLTQL